jgi:chromosome segregation ATPase
VSRVTEHVLNLVVACDEAMQLVSDAIDEQIRDVERSTPALVEPSFGKLDELLQNVDAQICVDGDRSTLVLDESLERLEKLERPAFDVLTDQIEHAVASAEQDLARAHARRDECSVLLSDWMLRAEDPDPAPHARELVDDARERIAEYREALHALDAEIAEYRATVEHLRGVHELVMERGYRFGGSM